MNLHGKALLIMKIPQETSGLWRQLRMIFEMKCYYIYIHTHTLRTGFRWNKSGNRRLKSINNHINKGVEEAMTSD